jgi:RNA-directed DNA polymerase
MEKLNELDLSLEGVYGSLRVDLDEYLMTLRRQHDPYTDLEFEKRDGTSRYISAPHEPLLGIQDALHKQYLSEPKLFHDSAFAYIKGRSAVQCARKHEDAEWLIKVDIDDFFHTIDERMVYREFRRRGVTKFNSFVLARFLTREPSKFKGSLPSKYRRHQKNPASKLFDVETRRIGFLPQGSPTSGAISNLVFFDLDNQFEELAHQRGLSYSRYSDDLIFSSTDDFERRNATQTLQTVVRTLRRKGFDPHLGKTRIVPPGARKQVLGVLVGSPGLRLPRARKSRLDRELWAVRTHGFTKHARHMREPNEFKVLNRLYGTLIWANEIDPSWSRPRIEALREAAESQLGEISGASKVEKD